MSGQARMRFRAPQDYSGGSADRLAGEKLSDLAEVPSSSSERVELQSVGCHAPTSGST